ncbi:MAG: 16S rRNA (cytosine(967)-C(5))-methyltransferase RsmB [Fibrobacteria bacterium]|nr:16S rRNA (cytosine(967)-C(5))-methyltransferase RsmB [Fibrobacteria bacterium]
MPNPKSISTNTPTRRPKGYTSRLTAYNILMEHYETGKYLKALWRRMPGNLPDNDKTFVREVCLGTLRWQRLLDYNINLYLSNKKTKPSVMTAIRLTAYQLLFLSSVPAYAAVNTGVEIIKQVEGKHAAGFGNAILKKIQQNGLRRRTGNSAKALSINTSHPLWLVKKWAREIPLENLMHTLNHNNNHRRIWVRINLRKTSVSEFLSQMTQSYPDLHPVNSAAENFPFIRFESGISHLLHSDMFKEGHFSFQDPASWYAMQLANWKEGQAVLDLCSAPGGKAACLVEMASHDTPVICSDVSFYRLKQIENTRERLGHQQLTPLVMDGRAPCFKTGFDIVLVDAPCSNLGVLDKRPEAKWRNTEAQLSKYALLQKELLHHASEVCKLSGSIVYSTCSPEPEETMEVIQAFLDEHEFWEIEDAGNFLPSHLVQQGCMHLSPGANGFDGFFAARLIRKV